MENTFCPRRAAAPTKPAPGRRCQELPSSVPSVQSQQTMVFLAGPAAQEHSSLVENREPFTTSSCKPGIDVRSSCGKGISCGLKEKVQLCGRSPARWDSTPGCLLITAAAQPPHTPSTPPIGRRYPLFLVPPVCPAFLPFLLPLPSGLRHLTAPQWFY